MNPCENGSSSSPRMRVTWPSSISMRSPHVASQSGHVLNATRVVMRDDTTAWPRQTDVRPRATRSRSASRTVGHSSSTTLYQAESRFSPVPHEHVLAVDALERGREAGERRAGPLVEGVRLELDPPAAEDVERVLQLQELGLGVRAGAPGRRREPRPADLEAPVLRPQRQEAGRSDGPARRDEHGREREVEPGVDARQRIVHPGLPRRRGVRGWTIGSHRQTRGSRDASQRSSAWRCASGSSRTIRPSSVGVVHRSTRAGQYTRAMPIYEYACMECEDHFDELVRSDDQVITCPSCNATDVLKQISPSPFTARPRSRRSAAARGGGGCCGGGPAAAAEPRARRLGLRPVACVRPIRLAA